MEIIVPSLCTVFFSARKPNSHWMCFGCDVHSNCLFFCVSWVCYQWITLVYGKCMEMHLWISNSVSDSTHSFHEGKIADYDCICLSQVMCIKTIRKKITRPVLFRFFNQFSSRSETVQVVNGSFFITVTKPFMLLKAQALALKCAEHRRKATANNGRKTVEKASLLLKK